MRKHIYSRLVPMFLLCLFFLGIVLVVFITASQYGITPDEVLQDSYGRSVLAWYTSFGKDVSFLSYAPDLYMSQHGPFFETIVAVAQQFFGHQWYTRAVVTGLGGVVGVLAIALCGNEIGGPWLALVASLMLWLYPRYFGALFNNSKDIPFAAGMTLILWTSILLVSRWEKGRVYIKNSILVGVCIGIATSIRVTAVLWYPLLLLVLIWWWLRNAQSVFREKKLQAVLKKQVLASCLIGVVSFITMMVLWPYIMLEPFAHFYESIQVMQRYPWNGSVLFGGVIYQGQHLPWTYVPFWLLIGSPLIIVVGAVPGIFLTFKTSFTHRADPIMPLVLFALVTPILMMILLHATLYDGPRQFLFVVPIMVLVAAFGLVRLISLLLCKGHRLSTGLTVMLVFAACANYVLLIEEMNDLHPYEYAYFNGLVGGIEGASGKYDIDYWRICSKPAAEWLQQHYQAYTRKAHPTVTSRPIVEQAMLYLSDAFVEDDTNPDFYIGSTKDGFDRAFSNYKVLHTEWVSGTGVAACVVKMKS